MGCLAVVVVTVLTALLGILAAGTLAGIAVDWYGISSFEGGSGLFVVGMSLLGGLIGAVIALVVAAAVRKRPTVNVLKLGAFACGVVLMTAGVVAGVARLLADIPPEIDGHRLHIQVELRWPRDTSPEVVTPADTTRLWLGALHGERVRVMEEGVLFVEDTRADGNYQVVSGIAPLFTERGDRLIELSRDGKATTAFIVPLPARPNASAQTWSDWVPLGTPNNQGRSLSVSYRFRVIRRADPARVQRIGDFEVATRVDEILPATASDKKAARSTFAVAHRGTTLESPGGLSEVAVVAQLTTPAGPALLLRGTDPELGRTCVLLSTTGTALVTAALPSCPYDAATALLTADQSRFVAARQAPATDGWLDTTTFAEPGLYLVGRVVVDTRTLTVTQVAHLQERAPRQDLPPVALSPDEHSFVWLREADNGLQLAVSAWARDETYALPIDRTRMRYADPRDIGPDWVAHHFAWHRGDDGADRLVARDTYTPLPYRGALTLGPANEHQMYLIGPGAERLRTQVVTLLVESLGATPAENTDGAHTQQVRLGEDVLGVSIVESLDGVVVSTYHGDPGRFQALAHRLDALWASRRYDAAFEARAIAAQQD